MRTIRVKEESSDRTLLWVLAGTSLGVLAGILVAERMSGRKLTARGLIRRGRKLALDLVDRGQELMEAATQLRESWGEGEEFEEEELEEEELEETEEPDSADGIEAGYEEKEEEEEDDDVGDEEEDDEAEADEEGEGALDERVLEAFMNDPVLAERAIEIESEDGTIDLHGRVRTAREVQHAVTIARGVPGVVEVRQRLRVRGHR